ncbi:hypothetical protein [Mycobacteroides franklinii]|uniref:Uncharacterized protein n=1 Tax=Mycobacteroides franklinii TaxID=948102 RepID=A0A4R5P819_9MYCO|nr:hypothetical protein [Mycobacteroides franklinii]ORA58123.1 hypothetical protein BST24_23125 [Mycobacteroides franklinii]TDH19548.1 hypothetical protein EJ571_23745 [Mycobacteroides franklinii]TDZ42297.1 hypothetical protein CCUG64054_02341 [Mycobacteroides franklinii]TDZ52445.1 hypothetical protein CCUG63697_00926 [Mycobacteroides franklinii]TDZ55852.1 hypothetical protein CCUG63696_02343 [Mycobacteroides franklinii]
MVVKKRVRGIELRYLLTLYLHRFGARDVSELVQMLDHRGFDTSGRMSKAISDALRWEVRRGRVIHYGRGSYGPGGIPRGTEYRMLQREKALLSLVAGHEEECS